MNPIQWLKVEIYNLIRTCRFRVIAKLLDDNCRTLLDIGCQELFFYEKLKNRYEITLADYRPRSERILREDVQKLSFPDQAFDIVLCQQVLEHVPDPLKALAELKRVTRRQLIISVPYEPYFTFWRFLSWEKQHLWAITPQVLKIHLGKPVWEKKIVLKRYYLAVWQLKPSV